MQEYFMMEGKRIEKKVQIEQNIDLKNIAKYVQLLKQGKMGCRDP